MSFQSAQHVIGTLIVLIAIAMVVTTPTIALGLGVIGGILVGWGIMIPHDKDCKCLNCMTKRTTEDGFKSKTLK